MARGFDIEAAARHLRRADPALASWMRRVPAVSAEAGWRRPLNVVDALSRSILYQQLSGKAAATIVGRVEQAVQSARLDAAALARIDDDALRACGVSGNKARALRDLQSHAERGLLPDARAMARMDDEAIIAALTAVRGIGRWTVQMLLMFRLGRPDQLPVDDLGVRKGLQCVDALETLPGARELAQRGEIWGPYRTLASLYLWRVADAGNRTATPTPRSQD
ncbi:MAG: DNA-3-methyladenine glycosylase 2 family protein [Lysobacteraceae bacterium]|jgi:DNA-3-methyladenine glycosylase II